MNKILMGVSLNGLTFRKAEVFTVETYNQVIDKLVDELKLTIEREFKNKESVSVLRR